MHAYKNITEISAKFIDFLFLINTFLVNNISWTSAILRPYHVLIYEVVCIMCYLG